MYMMLIHESHVFEPRNFETKFEVCDPRTFFLFVLCVCVRAFQPVTPPEKLFKDKHVEFPLFS